MSAAAALPRDSGNVINNAAQMTNSNALSTEFFFDTATTTFENSQVTPSKNTNSLKSQRPPHSSLLVTPLHRSSGGQVKKNPSPSILEGKYLPKTTPGALSTRTYSSPAVKTTPTPLSSSKGAAASPSYSTPLSKKFSSAAAAATTTSPSASLLNASSDIKARLRQIAASTPIASTTGGRSYTRSFTTPAAGASSSSFSAAKDFRISAAGTGSRTPYSAESLAVRSRANQMQTELQLRDLEVHKLAAAAAAARKERDEQKLRADKLEAIANLSRGSTGNGVMKSSSSPYGAAVPFYHSPQRQHVAPSPPARISPATTTSPAQPPSNEAQIAVSELRREAETLRQQVEMAASELQAQRARADAAEERARYAEARAGADSAAHNANESELRTLKQKLHSMENEVKRLATDLAIAEDRAGLAEASLAEGRSNNTTNSASRGINNSAALTEVALTAQIRALATQLKVAKTEAATAQQELARFKAETQGHAAVHEGTTASILSANRELEAALAHASQNLEIRGEELEQARGAVARLAAENAALHAALKDRDEQYAALEYRMNNNSNSEGTLRANAAEKQLVAAQQELKIAKTRIADLEHAISKNSHTKGFSSSASTGPSPLRDIVGSLRAELEDRELRLAAAEEELATERRRAGDLHRQVLDQAVEIDDLHRETHTGDDILRKELEQARKEAHSAALELAEVRQQQESKEASRAGAIRTAEVELIKQLREELDARESEVMELQGQLHTLVAMNNGGGRGGVPGGGGAGEVENWLMGP